MPSPRRIRTPVSPARWATSSIISESRSPGPTGRRPCTCPTSAPIGPAPSSAQTFAEEEATMPLRAIPKTAAGPAPGEPVPTPYPYTDAPAFPTSIGTRSEEHTSELQSRLHLVCRLLLEKKKTKKIQSQKQQKT